MNKSDLAAAVRDFHGGVSRAVALRAVDAVFDTARQLLVEEGAFRVRGFGVIEVRHRRARRGGDPRTGRPFVSAPRRTPFFRASRALLAELNPPRGEVS